MGVAETQIEQNVIRSRPLDIELDGGALRPVEFLLEQSDAPADFDVIDAEGRNHGFGKAGHRGRPESVPGGRVFQRRRGRIFRGRKEDLGFSKNGGRGFSRSGFAQPLRRRREFACDHDQFVRKIGVVGSDIGIGQEPDGFQRNVPDTGLQSAMPIGGHDSPCLPIGVVALGSSRHIDKNPKDAIILESGEHGLNKFDEILR